VEIEHVEKIFLNIADEIKEVIDDDMAIFAITFPHSKNLDIFIYNQNLHHHVRTDANAVFHSFKILNGDLFLISRQFDQDDTTFTDRILTEHSKKIKSCLIVPIQHEQVGIGAMLIGSHRIDLTASKKKLERFDLDAMISAQCQESKKKSAITVIHDHENQFYKNIFMNSMTANAIVESDGTIVGMNQAFQQLTGYPDAEVHRKMSITDFFQSADKKRIQQRLMCKIHPDDFIEFTLVKKNGEEHTVQLYLNLIANTKQFIVNLVDVTMLIAEETEKKEEQEKIAVILHTIAALDKCLDLSSLQHTIDERLSDICDYDNLLLLIVNPMTMQIELFQNIEGKIKQNSIKNDEVCASFFDIMMNGDKIDFYRLCDLLKLPRNNTYQSQLSWKLMYAGKIVGAFCIAHKVDNAYAHFHIDLLTQLANYIANALTRMAQYEAAQQTIERLSQQR